jgi:hypothetical protein
MGRRTFAAEFLGLASTLLTPFAMTGGLKVTALQAQSTSPPGGLVATDWGPGTKGITNPLLFNQYNPSLGTLTSIDITLTTNITNDYESKFVETPMIVTIFVAPSQYRSEHTF